MTTQEDRKPSPAAHGAPAGLAWRRATVPYGGLLRPSAPARTTPERPVRIGAVRARYGRI